jgi:hypothetical protein
VEVKLHAFLSFELGTGERTVEHLELFAPKERASRAYWLWHWVGRRQIRDERIYSACAMQIPEPTVAQPLPLPHSPPQSPHLVLYHSKYTHLPDLSPLAIRTAFFLFLPSLIKLLSKLCELLGKYQRYNKIRHSQLRVFIIHIWEISYNMFRPKGLIFK